MSTKNTKNLSTLSKTKKKKSPHKEFTYVKSAGKMHEFQLTKNGLRVLYLHVPKTGVVTSNITYLVGAKDENRGETGIAHMLEHMLFKPTEIDIINKSEDSAAMRFERETGIILNANTWKDRTTYYFSYPKEHFTRAINIESERMTSLIFTDSEFIPEQGNVLSEHDMYNGDPHFALGVALCGTAFTSHPYGHETIGYREDIERYTTKSLERFYKTYYRPDNATITVVGDVTLEEALQTIYHSFGKINNPQISIPRYNILEPAQEGERRVTIERKTNTHILTFAVKHAGFPSKEWWESAILLSMLAEGSESILHEALIDTSLATEISYTQEPTKDMNIALISITLVKPETHTKIEKKVKEIISALSLKTIQSKYKRIIVRMQAEELFQRDSSLHIAMELTEYIASGDWTTFYNTPTVLSSITPKRLLAQKEILFNPSHLTIGIFKSSS